MSDEYQRGLIVGLRLAVTAINDRMAEVERDIASGDAARIRREELRAARTAVREPTLDGGEHATRQVVTRAAVECWQKDENPPERDDGSEWDSSLHEDRGS